MNTIKIVRLTSVALALAVAPAFAAEETQSAPAPAAAAETPAAEAGKTYQPLAEARAQIGDVIADPAKMTEVMKNLSPADQKAFVADVNAAINKMPGSAEEKAAKFLNVNRAALKGASKGNMANVLAVTFATVPPESLIVISERYAVDLFNRDTPQSKNVDDAAFEKISKEVIGKVEETTAGSDEAGVRNTLAILMFVRASNGAPPDLSDKLVDTLKDGKVRELAKTEWIPAAMAEGDKKSYEALLAYADAGYAPNIDSVLALAGPQILDAVMLDITSGMNDAAGFQTTPILDQAFGGYDENTIYIHYDTKSPLAPGNPIVVPKQPEPKPYPYSVF